MKINSLFEKFDLLADAPKAIERLRELILRLATSGRIANQDSSDQSGSDLLREMFIERDRLIASGRAKYRVEGKAVIAGDTLDIPSSWVRCRISEVCDLQTGATPSRQVASYFGGDIPWLISGDINKREITECEGRITEAGLKNSNCKIIPPNSVLIALNGQGKTRGTVALLRIKGTLNQSLVAIIPYSPDKLLPEYIFWNLRGRYYPIRDITGQDQRRGLNMKLVGRLRIPVPPIAEQKRIVARVEELMSLCDQLEKQQEERETRHAVLASATLARFTKEPTSENLEYVFHRSFDVRPVDIRKSILSLAMRGKLVRQDPNDEPADKLLELLANEYSSKKRSRQDVTLEPASEELPQFQLPTSWKWARFQDVALIASNLVNPNGFLDFTHLAPDNIEKGTGLLLHCSTVREDKVTSSNHRFYPGQIVYSKIRPNLSKVVIVDFEGLCSADMYPIDALIDVNYLYRYMLSESFLIQAVKTDTRVAMPKINQMELNAIAVPVPPLAEQQRIVAKVDQLMTLVDKLEAQLAASRSTAANLLDAMVFDLTKTATNGLNGGANET